MVRRFLEAHAKRRSRRLEEMLAPDFVDHNVIPGQGPGREGYLRSFAEYHAAYSDTHYDIEKQMAEGDKVVTTLRRKRLPMTRRVQGLVPTGKEFKRRIILSTA